MKKLSLALTAILMSATLLFGCTGAQPKETTAQETTTATSMEKSHVHEKDEKHEHEKHKHEEHVDLKLVTLKGPTAMGLVKLMDDAETHHTDAYHLHAEVASSPDEVAPKLLKKEVDLAAVPANMAAALYKKSEGKIRVLAVNTLGVLYLLEKGDSVKGMADLAGKTIFASGKGATPEYVLNYILKANGLEIGKDVQVEWKAEHAECLAALQAQPGAIAMLPQPFATTAQLKDSEIKSVIDFTAEWDKLQANEKEPSTLITGVLVTREDVLQAHPESVKAFLKDYEASVKFAQENVAETAELLGKFEILKKEVAAKALPKTHLTFMTGPEMKTKLGGYLKVLFEQEPKSVGGALPADDFYYMACCH